MHRVIPDRCRASNQFNGCSQDLTALNPVRLMHGHRGVEYLVLAWGSLRQERAQNRPRVNQKGAEGAESVYRE